MFVNKKNEKMYEKKSTKIQGGETIEIRRKTKRTKASQGVNAKRDGEGPGDLQQDIAIL